MKRLSIFRIRLNWNYLLLSQVLLLIEIIIAVFIHDQFIRPYAGDFLVVILLYCFVRAGFDLQVFPVALSVLLFACFVEWTQYMKLADSLHLGNHSLLRTLIGDYFCWTDILCYTGGVITVLVFEKMHRHLTALLLPIY